MSGSKIGTKPRGAARTKRAAVADVVLQPLPPHPRRAAHQRRTKADDRYRQLLEASPDAVFVIAAEGPGIGQILDANTRAGTMHGYTRSELLRMRIGELDVFEDAHAVPERMRELLEHGATRFEVRHRRKDGSTFPVEVTAQLGTVDGRRCAVSFNRDISDRHASQHALFEAQIRHEMAARAGAIGFWDWDLLTDTVHFSPEWKAQIGYLPDEIPHHYSEWERRVHPEDLPGALSAIHEHVLGHVDSLQLEFRLRHKDGSYRWIYARGQMLRTTDGEPTRMLGCHVDMTDRRLAEARSRETELLLRSFYDSPGVMRGLVEIDGDDIVHLSDNVVAGQFFGFDPAQLVGKRASELGVDRATIDLWIGYYRRSANEGRPVSFDYLHQGPTEQHRLMCTVVWIGEHGGRPRHAYAAFDRTEQDRAEAKAAETAERMRAIYETEPECIKTVSLDGRLLDINPAGVRMVEAEHIEELLGRNIADAVHPDDRPAFLELHQRVAAGGSGNLEFRIIGLRGTTRWMETNSVPLRDHRGTITSVLSVTRDVTARHQAERERAHLAAQIEQMQRLEAIGTLSGGIAHDFNNILAAISGNLELAMLQPEPADLQNYLGEIRQASNRARSLVRQILTFSSQKSPDRHPLDLRPIFAEAIRFLRATIPSTFRIEQQVAADLPLVLADAAQIHQVLINLGTNAWHAMEDRPGTMTIVAERVELDAATVAGIDGLQPGGHVRLAVGDTGKGMDETTRNRCFEPFFTTKPVGKGTGLGLSVVHGIVRSHGGGIVVRSEPGQGTTIAIYLPVAAGGAQPEQTPQPPIVGHGEHVLLIDDEPAVLRATERLLEANGYRVTTSAVPKVVLETLRASPTAYDILVTDHEMPDLQGLRFAGQVHELAPQLPILMCSGHLPPHVVASAEAHGIHRLLQKPIAFGELSHAIHEALHASTSRRRTP